MKTLHIAMLAPIKRPLTPDTTVSRQRIIADLTSGLLQKGHRVTIFATKDSSFSGAQIIGIPPKGLNFLPQVENPFYQHTSYLTLMIKKMLDMQDSFDIVHNHMYPEYLPLLSLSAMRKPLLTTVHSQMIPETADVLRVFPEAQLVAISQMAKKLSSRDMHVVHNSVDTDLFFPTEAAKDYLLCVGRMSAAKDDQGNFLDPKGVGNAIKVAQLAGERLKIVGNVEDPEFFETIVRPHLNDKIEFIGNISPEQTLTRQEMVKLFAGAKVFINAINWQEPFGLVMAEALACGTPVVAFDRGAVSEIVVDGKVGFVIDPDESRQSSDNSYQTESKIETKEIKGLVEAVKRIGEIDRSVCREHAITNFSTQRMVSEYEKLYNMLLYDKQHIITK